MRKRYTLAVLVKFEGFERLRDGRYIATFRKADGTEFKVVGPSAHWPDELLGAPAVANEQEAEQVNAYLREQGVKPEELDWIDVPKSHWALIEKHRFLAD